MNDNCEYLENIVTMKALIGLGYSCSVQSKLITLSNPVQGETCSIFI